jgi:hypothetical protein
MTDSTMNDSAAIVPSSADAVGSSVADLLLQYTLAAEMRRAVLHWSNLPT